MLGIVGMGGIGRDLKKKAEALGMKVQYHNRSKLSDEMSGGAKYVGFEELLGSSDVISLNVPLNVSLRLCCERLVLPSISDHALREAICPAPSTHARSRNQLII